MALAGLGWLLFLSPPLAALLLSYLEVLGILAEALLILWLLVIDIHPLLWRFETFGLTHQLCISNQTEITQRRGTRKQATNQSGINEEGGLRGSERSSRTSALLLLEIFIFRLFLK